jgi:hypothetical protein
MPEDMEKGASVDHLVEVDAMELDELLGGPAWAICENADAIPQRLHPCRQLMGLEERFRMFVWTHLRESAVHATPSARHAVRAQHARIKQRLVVSRK